MHPKDNDVKKDFIDLPGAAEGIPRRTFLKGMLVTGRRPPWALWG